MTSEDLNHLGNDPGAVKFGNFINYYSFHNVEHRTNNLNKQMFPAPAANEPFLCLDIGCNTGELTKDLYQYLKTIYPGNDIHMLAVDVDPTLIARAQETIQIPNITFMTCNIMSDNDQKLIQNYSKSYRKKRFDVTFCFSVTMWIHLNNGDDGLLDFINYIKKISRSIIIEPQPWKCYRNAQRRLKKSGSTFPLYDSLKIRSDVEFVIENKVNEGTHEKVCGSLNPSWNRKILSFHDTKELITK
ncbi:probable RNA methyltransferase CG11342 [Cydia strobilella]|uniref:probable RNA methyltransferase CG11342 n=1 Tax=Cydia strobilella TaxID=1100964 RepID=UPI003007EB95